MKKIKRYLLLSSWDAFELSQTVNEYLKDGWELYGTPSVGIVDYLLTKDKLFAQAIVWME